MSRQKTEGAGKCETNGYRGVNQIARFSAILAAQNDPWGLKTAEIVGLAVHGKTAPFAADNAPLAPFPRLGSTGRPPAGFQGDTP